MRTKVKEPEPALFEVEQEILAPAAPKPIAVKTAKSAKGKTGTDVAKVERLPTHPNLLAAIIHAAADPTCQPEKIHALLDVRDRIMQQQAKVGFRRAYRAAKGEMPAISKDNKIVIEKNGKLIQSTPYATYENISKIIKPLLKDHGLDLSLQSEPKPTGEGVLMRATLSYIAETEYGDYVHTESSVVPMPPDPTGSKNAAQAVSSALKYAKRNAVILVLDLISEAPEDADLDGHSHGKVRRNAKGAPASPDDISTDDGKITMDQAQELASKIKASGLSTERFCEKYKIDGPTDLPAASFKEAIAACDAYAAEAAKRRK